MSTPSVPHDYVGATPPIKPAVRKAPNPLYKAAKALASLRLTVVLFSLSMALVFFGTLGMTQDSIESTVRHYFRCWVAWIDLQGLVEFGKVFLGMDKTTTIKAKIPFPGGYTIGWVMFFNLVAAHIIRFKFTWKRTGIILLHAGVIVLLAGEFLTGQLSVETRMRIPEGESSEFVFSMTETELAIIDPSDPKVDQVVVVPGHMLVDASPEQWISHADVPFDFQVTQYYANADIRDRRPDDQRLADRGVGLRMSITGKPKVKGTDSTGEVNQPAAYLVLRGKNGERIGTYLVSCSLLRPQSVSVGGKIYQLAFRFKRTYKPYQVHLISAEHKVYAGTNTARDYASTVRVTNPDLGEYGPIRIWMNHPMRYAGETFYQSDLQTNPTTGLKTTGLQVVDNPAWTFPYFACAMVALGMGFHFLLRLITFLNRGGIR